MEVLVGPTLGIEVSSSSSSSSAAAAAYVRERAAAQGGAKPDLVFSVAELEKTEDEEEDDPASEKSSSIGAPDDSDDEEDEDGDVSSADSRKKKLGSLGSLTSLEECLPIKRGLSNHFAGKSKSFTNLSEVCASSSSKDLEKSEHPFNKKRRILRWSKNFSLLPSAKSMPLFPRSEDDDAHQHHSGEGDEDGDGGEGRDRVVSGRLSELHGRKLNVFKSSSCFALSDLHEEDEDENDDEDGRD